MASKKKWKRKYYDAAYANLHEVQGLEACIRGKDRAIDALNKDIDGLNKERRRNDELVKLVKALQCEINRLKAEASDG